MEELDFNTLMQSLKPRDQNSHKGNFGHVLVIGGDDGFSGAPRLAAEAALRVGAGLVSVATRSYYADNLNINRPEIMSHAVGSSEDLSPLLAKATVIILGPGLGRSGWSVELWRAVINTSLPLVLDADGLNWLADDPRKSSHWILTPHPGEAARLLKKTSASIQKNRVEAVHELQNTYDGVIVLKGAGSLIATKKGVSICRAGNPGMASGGMGDALSGVIGGLLAQGLKPDIAAKLGVVLHATAGDLAARDGERGLLASDLMPYLRQLVNHRE